MPSQYYVSFIKYLADLIMFYLDTILGLRDIKHKKIVLKEFSFHLKEDIIIQHFKNLSIHMNHLWIMV